jgi:hypothetical protein
MIRVEVCNTKAETKDLRAEATLDDYRAVAEIERPD